MHKISLIGAGNIGGTLALIASLKQLGTITLVDVAEGIPQGKGLDLAQCAATYNLGTSITGTNDMADIADSSVIIVTAGSPRKPGMSRDDLLKINGQVISSIAHQIKKYSPNAFVIVVTNPLDVMVWVMQQESGLPPHKVVGMAGILDSARFRYFLSQTLKGAVQDIQTLVLGGHGDTMVPLLRYTTIAGVPLLEMVQKGVVSQATIDSIVERTRQGGGEIVNLLKTGSAFYAPAAAAMEMAESYLRDQKRLLPCAAYLTGQYGLKDIYVGAPIIIGAQGVEKIVELNLTADEQAAYLKSAQAVKTMIEEYKKL